MIQKVTLPKLGETVEKSTIERWIKKEGDSVTTGDILCEGEVKHRAHISTS